MEATDSVVSRRFSVVVESNSASAKVLFSFWGDEIISGVVFLGSSVFLVTSFFVSKLLI